MHKLTDNGQASEVLLQVNCSRSIGAKVGRDHCDYGDAIQPVGQRVASGWSARRHGHWKTSIFVAALHHNRATAPFPLEPMRVRRFNLLDNFKSASKAISSAAFVSGRNGLGLTSQSKADRDLFANHERRLQQSLMRRDRASVGETCMYKVLVVALGLVTFASAAVADDRGTPQQQRDCTTDAMTYCSEYIFAPDRNAKIGACLWQHRGQVSKACQSELRPRRR